MARGNRHVREQHPRRSQQHPGGPDVNIIYLLIPFSVVLVALVAWAFIWAIGSGQFDDLDAPAHRILEDDDAHREKADHERS